MGVNGYIVQLKIRLPPPTSNLSKPYKLTVFCPVKIKVKRGSQSVPSREWRSWGCVKK